MNTSFSTRPRCKTIIFTAIALSIAAVGLLGCSIETQRGDAWKLIDGEHQDLRREIAIDFAKNPGAAQEKYLTEWKVLRRKQSLSVRDKIFLVTVAGEMMALRREGEYEKVAASFLGDPSPEVVGGAIATLAQSRDIKTIATLQKFGSSANERYATEAINALLSRHLRASRQADRAIEAEMLESAINMVCAQPQTLVAQQECDSWQRHMQQR